MAETTFTHYSFREWIAINHDIKPIISENKCFECDGLGRHECECGDEHECRNCDGTGKYKKTITLEEIYSKQLEKDEIILQKWLSRQTRYD
jgi:DnaJ-class molecular chaperone